MALDLCNIVEVKDHVDGLSGVDTYDSMIERLINAVSEQIEKYCDREFLDSESDVTEYYDGDGSISRIVIRRPPITSVTSVHDDTDRTYGADTLIASTDYVVYNDTGSIVLDGSTFSRGLKNIKIIYQGGYTTSTIPSDLNLACILQCAFMFQRRKELGLTSVSGSSGTITKYAPIKLLPATKQLLNPYRIYRDI
jgi:hypothetical protein